MREEGHASSLIQSRLVKIDMNDLLKILRRVDNSFECIIKYTICPANFFYLLGQVPMLRLYHVLVSTERSKDEMGP